MKTSLCNVHHDRRESSKDDHKREEANQQGSSPTHVPTQLSLHQTTLSTPAPPTQGCPPRAIPLGP